jgi:hypothetical protein
MLTTVRAVLGGNSPRRIDALHRGAFAERPALGKSRRGGNDAEEMAHVCVPITEANNARLAACVLRAITIKRAPRFGLVRRVGPSMAAHRYSRERDRVGSHNRVARFAVQRDPIASKSLARSAMSAGRRVAGRLVLSPVCVLCWPHGSQDNRA